MEPFPSVNESISECTSASERTSESECTPASECTPVSTPVFDFVSEYKNKNAIRLHMPGHKGKDHLGCEAYDITEINGADSLFEADGIIKESEKNAGTLFCARTFYSCEGSSLSIRAMLFLAVLHAKKTGRKPHILAGRNAHKTFLSAAALLDFEVTWIYPENNASYLSCPITPTDIENAVNSAALPPTAVYVTSPDYLGNMLDIAELSKTAKKHGMLLLVDNAHGAYLKFLPNSLHPMDLGADICCDSAHKTLPVLTGGAYLHISESAPKICISEAKNALALFASTSPSYLILESLDIANAYLSCGYKEKLKLTSEKIDQLAEDLQAHGYELLHNEPLKITLKPKSYGFTGCELSDLLFDKNIACEFADPDNLVMMFTPDVDDCEMKKLSDTLLSLQKKAPITKTPPKIFIPKRAMSPREATLSPKRTVSAQESLGCILSAANVGCPPAVPIVACGEIISDAAIEAFRYYGIKECAVIT